MQETSFLGLGHSTDHLCDQRHEIFFLHGDLILKSATLTVFIDQVDILFLYN